MQGRNPRLFWKKYGHYYAFLAPTLIFLLFFQIYPILSSIYTSFTDLNMIKPNSGHFVGLKNYVKLLTNDSKFYPILWNSVVWVLGSTVLQYFFAIPASLLLNRKFPGRPVVRGLMMVPWVTPVIIMGLIWRWIYDGDYGLLNYVLGTSYIWLGDKTVVWQALLLVSLWKGLPYATLMFLAGLQGIPADLYEAAYVDGAGKLKQFWYVTLPMLMPVILVTALTSIVQSWTKFEVIWVLTSGGPGYTTSILPTYIYSKSFRDFQMGMGSAVSVIAMLIMMVFVLVYLRIYNKSSEKVG